MRPIYLMTLQKAPDYHHSLSSFYPAVFATVSAASPNGYPALMEDLRRLGVATTRLC